MLSIVVATRVAVLSLVAWLDRRLPRRDDRGQATAEYALVLLGVAAVALLLLAWATRSGKLGELFDAVIDNLIGKAR